MKIRTKDARWGEIFMASLFLGMISAFLGLVFAGVREGLVGWIPVFVMLASAVLMGVCAIFVKVLKWKWMEEYALPISMLGGWRCPFRSAILFTPRFRGGVNMDYRNSVHKAAGWMLLGLLMLFLVPAIICVRYGAWPEWTGFLRGLAGVLPIFWTVGTIEVLTYVRCSARPARIWPL
jgi:hypothetical protein